MVTGVDPALDHAIEASRLSHSTVGGSAFPPIADYAFISDCEVSALIAPSGNVEWLCLPRMDAASVFAAILDRDAGWFRVGPADVTVPAGRRYLPGTMVLETTWDTPTGWAVVRDVLLIGPWRHNARRSDTHQRVPTDHAAERVLLRTVRCFNGSIDFLLECEPAFDYGRGRGEWRHTGEGYGQAEVAAADSGPTLRLTTDLNLGIEGPRAIARRRLRAGDEVFCALSWEDGSAPESFSEAHERLARTSDFWHEWLSRGQFPDHPWRSYLQRSALTLKGLIYAPTGALLAASTSSLPETPGGERNYDYRYTWLRDSTFMLWGLYTLGFDREANDFFYFISDLAEGDSDLQIMYGIGGERELTEKHPRSSVGLRRGHARPDRQRGLGSTAARCVGGAAGLRVSPHPVSRGARRAALAHARAPGERGVGPLAPSGSGDLGGQGTAAAFHQLQGAVLGRGRPRRHAGRASTDHENADRWRQAAEEIHADICAHGTDERGVFCQHYETTALDASLLLMPLLGFLPSGRSACAGDRPRHRRRVDRRRTRPALPRRGDQ